MNIKEAEGAIEAILFAMGDAVELTQIAKALEQDPSTTEKIIHNMMDRCLLYTSKRSESSCKEGRKSRRDVLLYGKRKAGKCSCPV